mmetsp:Transcript_8180/g.14573  ORF Transcript_8180/g.14573 Transcript_8180/m.14573 type:complete len:561 (-) Transcript_8180:225-1907(-)
MANMEEDVDVTDVIEEVVDEFEEALVREVNSDNDKPEHGDRGGRAGRANENGRLSGDSWVSVVSEYEGEEGENAEALLFSQVEEEPKKVNAGDSKLHNEMLKLSKVTGKSVLDCVVEILRGTKVVKKKAFRRTIERWIWLGEDLTSIRWKSKKKLDEHGKLVITKLKKVKALEMEMQLTNSDNKTLVLTFASREEMLMWLTGLSCLIPHSAKIVLDNQPFPDRSIYDTMKDSWRGKLISSRKRINEYILLGGIGKGSFGKVKLAFSLKDKRFYAVKIPTTQRKQVGGQGANAGGGGGGGPTNLDSREEQAVMKKLIHPNICRQRDTLLDAADERIILVIEYMARGVVMDSGKLEGVKPLSEEGVREIMRDVVNGLEYLHFNEVVHRDIKPDNLLRAGDGTVKLGDFGECKIYNLKGASQAGKPSAPGTPAFLAPELCLSEHAPKAPPEAYPADIWSLGATIYYMVYGRAPFLAKSVFEIHDAICTQKLEFPRTPKTSKEIVDLLKKMLVKEPAKRITLQEMKCHPWFGEKVVQKTPLVKYFLTQVDIDDAIQPAIWKLPV